MSKTFPELLKRSRFVTYDPTISRVYTAPSQAITARGDWGFKFSVFRPNKAPYLEMRALDAGPGVRQDWRSAEKEARFISMWGDGRVPWRTRESGRRVQRNPLLASQPAPAAETEVLPNVDAMSPREFERYLEQLRARRGELKAQLEPTLPAGTETLAEASARGAVREQTTAGFQADILKQEIESPGATRTMAKPHRLAGLAYSSAPAAGAQLDPQRVHTGRVLDQAPRGANSYRGIEGVNAEWVVGLGGVTATGSSGTLRVSDRPTLSKFDYARERKHAGLARFAVKDATLEKPPRVLGLNQTGNPDPWVQRTSSAKRHQPFNSLRFDIKVAQTEPVRPGSAEWVARDTAAPANVGASGLGNLGGPKASRASASESHQAARRINAKVQGDTIDSILARIVRNDSK